MPSFEIETKLNVKPDTLSKDVLTMSGVNYELMPLVRMTAPLEWADKPLYDWPVESPVFTSTLMLFGFFPIDRHEFRFLVTGSKGFRECSSSLSNREWRHDRSIGSDGSSCIVRDTVMFEPKLKILGAIMLPIYKYIFWHRHKRLKAKYS